MTDIKNIRKKYGFSIREFSKRMNMDYSYLSKVENDHEAISIKSLEKIATEFDEPLDELLIAYGYLPDYTKESRKKDSSALNKAIKKASNKIMEEK